MSTTAPLRSELAATFTSLSSLVECARECAGAFVLLIRERPRIANGVKSPVSSVVSPETLVSSPSSTWWRRDVHADRRPFLLARNRITKAFRAWFETEGFEEVEAAALQVSPGNEAHLHAFATQALTISGEAAPLYLHTSPEFACKKLLAAGEEKIFSLGNVWRKRERGPLHHPEFTMLEWYRAGAPYQT